ncbi:uncharacterized protein LOC109722743 isoform X1 [Ananas comosus]|uniref:Uncharacterized protein LOC109722743 isoform X1 n=1 Tax=Ananas comosus TaxID=4615 RepID=A0A6P5GER1_ANACO|nr:uncharacterized protein LOC109722743 isoform X1 [Ananas comosus]
MSSSLSTLSPFSSSSSSFSLLPPKTLNPTELSFRAPGARPDSRPFFSCSPRRSKTLIRAPTSRSAAETSSPAAAATAQQGSTASDVVREFYDRINRRDLDGLEVLIGEDCVYEDLVFSRPFVGRKAIIHFFKKFTESISPDLQFVIDDISKEDSSAIGVTWHLEWQGKPFPFSKGCSFYRLEILDGKRQLVYGRDCVEPATKPGELALAIIRGVTWVLERFPQLADQF